MVEDPLEEEIEEEAVEEIILVSETSTEISSGKEIMTEMAQEESEDLEYKIKNYSL